MKRVKVIRKGIVTNQAELPTPFEPNVTADVWIADCLAKGKFGKPERWVREGDEDISEAIETREVEVYAAIPAITEMREVLIPAVVDEAGVEIEPERTEMQEFEVSPAVPAVTVTEYKLKAEYEIVIEDLTQEIEAEEQKKSKKKKAKERLQNLDIKARLDKANTIAAVKVVLQDVIQDLLDSKD